MEKAQAGFSKWWFGILHTVDRCILSDESVTQTTGHPTSSFPSWCQKQCDSQTHGLPPSSQVLSPPLTYSRIISITCLVALVIQKWNRQGQCPGGYSRSGLVPNGRSSNTARFPILAKILFNESESALPLFFKSCFHPQKPLNWGWHILFSY